MAQGSNGEVRALLHVVKDRGYLPISDCGQLIERTNAIGRMLRRLEQYLRRTKDFYGPNVVPGCVPEMNASVMPAPAPTGLPLDRSTERNTILPGGEKSGG